MQIKAKFLAIAMLAGLSTTVIAPSASALTPTGVDQAKKCVYNGQTIEFIDNISTMPACYSTPDDLKNPRLGVIDKTKSLSDLTKTQQWSPLHPDHYVGRDSMAAQPLPPNYPVDQNSAKISASIRNIADLYLPDRFKGWLTTGANVGGGVHAHDNIPIYTVDSSNPYQKTVTFDSTDGRVTNFPGIVHYNSGKIPVPENFKPSDGGDKAAAIYDTATGIYREYFGLRYDETNKKWTYASSGYWHGDKANKSVGENYNLGLVQGTSSVVGLSNSLTQIGIEEVKRGSIDHMISMTFPNYLSGPSYPAKLSDGSLDPAKFPHAPRVGQRFAIPASFDVEEWAKRTNADPINVMIVKAMQKYGGMVTDKNHWSTAFNFEHPYGMGKEGNPWNDDSQASALMSKYNPNKFPWEAVQWMPVNYAPVNPSYTGRAGTETMAQFTDNPIGSVNYDHVRWLQVNQYISTYAKSTFQKTFAANRGDAAQILYLMKGNNRLFDGSTAKDVKGTRSLDTAIDWVLDNGYMTTYSDSTFRSARLLTRSDLAIMLYKANGSPEVPSDAPVFTDIPSNSEAYNAARWAASEKIISASSTKFYPINAVNRGELAKAMHHSTLFNNS